MSVDAAMLGGGVERGDEDEPDGSLTGVELSDEYLVEGVEEEEEERE